MADGYKASCKCGYEAHILVGGNRSMGRTKTYYSPVFCRDCGKLGSSVFGLDAPTCTFCQSTNIVRYGNRELRADPSKKYHGWTSGLHFCPQCKDFGLRFKDTGGRFC
jgi:hypothetical protein